MNQILHIFKKDARHLWIEISISLILLAALVWMGPAEWLFGAAQTGPAAELLRSLVSILPPLTVISWLLLIARVIHGEVLVGDRQFWITRPYEWEKLMAAKLLFLVAFIYLPFLLMQMILLARAGFSLTHSLGELVLNLVFLSTIIFSLAATATVTRNFGRVALVLLAVFASVALLVVLSAATGIGFGFSPEPVATPVASCLIDAIALALGCAVIVLQYRARRTKMAWIILLAIPVAFLVILRISPDRLLADHTYPSIANADGAPVQISFVDRSGDRSIAGHGPVGPPFGKMITIKFPIQLSGIAQENAIVVDEAKLSLEAAGGRHWSSSWQGLGGSVLRPENDAWEVEIIVPARDYGRFEGVPVDAQLNLAFTEVKTGKLAQIAMPKPMKEFAVPGFGICVPQAGEFRDAENLSCRFAWRPPFTYVSTRWFDEPCAAAQAANDPGIEGDGWVGSIDNAEDWMFFPVVVPYMRLSNSMKIEHGQPFPRYLCPGTPATFTRYELVRRMQESLTIANLHFWTVDREN